MTQKKTKLILGISALLACNIANAQTSPVITSANQLHNAGDSIGYIDAGSFGFDPLAAGGSCVNWNYTNLSSAGVIGFKYEDPATTSGNSPFPTANEAMKLSSAPGHEWFETSATQIKRLGYTSPTGGDIIYHGGGFVRYQLPFQAGDTWSTTGYGGATTMALGGDSTVIQNGSYSATVDAYGTLNLPSGTIYDAVRVHVTESFDISPYISGTPFITINTVDDYYFWFTENIQDPVLIYGTTTANGSVTKVLRYQSVTTAAMDLSTTLLNGTLTVAETGANSYQWVDCNNSDAPINGATGQSFTPTTPGSYAVKVSVSTSGCTTRSGCTFISSTGPPTGIADTESKNQVNIYPNPSNGIFNIKMADGNNSNYMLNVVNVLGETVYTKLVQASNNQIDVSFLDKGVYFVKIYSKENNFTQKVIIK